MSCKEEKNEIHLYKQKPFLYLSFATKVFLEEVLSVIYEGKAEESKMGKKQRCNSKMAPQYRHRANKIYLIFLIQFPVYIFFCVTGIYWKIGLAWWWRVEKKYRIKELIERVTFSIKLITFQCKERFMEDKEVVVNSSYTVINKNMSWQSASSTYLLESGIERDHYGFVLLFFKLLFCWEDVISNNINERSLGLDKMERYCACWDFMLSLLISFLKTIY